MMNFGQILINMSGIIALCYFGHFKLVSSMSKISRFGILVGLVSRMPD